MKKPNHILVIRLSAMGDAAMAVPVLRTVLQTYPDIKLTVVTKLAFVPLFKDIPRTSIIAADVYGKHRNFGILSLAKQAKNQGIDTVADLHNVLRSKIIGCYLSLTGIKTKKIDKGRKEKKQLVQANGKKINQLKTTHQRYADVFVTLGLPIDLENHNYTEQKKLSSKLHEIIGQHSKKLIGIAPFAAHKGKVYPISFIKEVIRQLDETGKYKIFLFGGGDQEKRTLDVIAAPYEQVTSMVGVLSFEEELSLIANLDLMLSMDSGNGHLAAMYNVKVITLWGVTHPYAGFVPFNQPNSHQLISNREKYPMIPTSIYGNKYPDIYENCMESIPVKVVVEKILEVI